MNVQTRITRHGREQDMQHVEMRAVSKRYGEFTAIRDLNLGVGKGEFCALLGPSGCGKSTILRMIAGLEAVNSGSVFINGADVTRQHPAKRRIAMVFQSYALYPHLTVRQNIAFSLSVAGAPREVQAKARRRGRGPAPTRPTDGPQAGTAFRRAAPARRHRPGAGARAGGLPVRRAALQSRRHVARADADRTGQAPQGRWAPR